MWLNAVSQTIRATFASFAFSSSITDSVCLAYFHPQQPSLRSNVTTTTTTTHRHTLPRHSHLPVHPHTPHHTPTHTTHSQHTRPFPAPHPHSHHLLPPLLPLRHLQHNPTMHKPRDDGPVHADIVPLEALRVAGRVGDVRAGEESGAWAERVGCGVVWWFSGRWHEDR
jgi:hypothetical protein